MKRWIGVCAVLGMLSCVRPCRAGFAPSGNPTVTVFELRDGGRITTDYDTRSVLTGSWRGKTRWRLPLAKVGGRYGPPSSFDESAVIMLPGERVFLLRGAQYLEAHEVARGQKLFIALIAEVADKDNAQLHEFAVSPDGTRLAMGGSECKEGVWTDRVRVFDARRGTLLQGFNILGAVRKMNWSSDTRLSVAYSNPAAWSSPQATTPIPGVPLNLTQDYEIAAAPSLPPQHARTKSHTRKRTTRKRTHSARARR